MSKPVEGKKNKEWLEYQELAARIYSEFSPFAVVKHDDEIMGEDSGTGRQIDVSIRTNVAGHEILVIVQARRRKRNADVNAVGELAEVKQDVRASKAVLVSNTGFTKSAKRLARKRGIDLCSLHDAKSRAWPLSITIPLIWIERRAEADLSFDCFGTDAFRASPASKRDLEIHLSRHGRDWLFSRDGGETRYDLFDEFRQFWKKDPKNREPGREHEWSPEPGELYLKVAEDAWLGVRNFRLRYRAFADGWRGDVPFSDCRGIMNQSTDTLTARALLSSHDIPTQKNKDWPTVEDPDGAAKRERNVIIVECPDLLVDGLTFHTGKTELVTDDPI